MGRDIDAVQAWLSDPRSLGWRRCRVAKNKKADVVQRPKAFAYAGVLPNEPPGSAELPFIQSSDDLSGTAFQFTFTAAPVQDAKP